MKLREIRLEGLAEGGEQVFFCWRPDVSMVTQSEYLVAFETPDLMHLRKLVLAAGETVFVRQIAADGESTMTGETDIPAAMFGAAWSPAVPVAGKVWAFLFVEKEQS